MSSPWPGTEHGPAARRLLIAPSLLSADFAHLGEEAKRAEESGADVLHLDVMDGSFVPNITFGPPVIKALRPLTGLPFDAHLMINRPEVHLSAFADAGCDAVTVHVEADGEEALHRTLAGIRERGMRAGITLRPATPLDRVEPFLEEIDLLLVMSVDPGFGGQPFIAGSGRRIREACELRGQGGANFQIEVDGGIKSENVSLVASAGADILVAGSALYGPGDMAERVASLRKAAERGRLEA